MSSAEFSDWIAFYALHPFGSERDNLHTAMLASLFANAHRSKEQQPFGVEDFMLRTAEERERQNASQLMSFMLQMSGKKQ